MLQSVNIENFDIKAVRQGRKTYIMLSNGIVQEVEVIEVPGTSYVVAEMASSGAPQGMFDAATGKPVATRANIKLVIAAEKKVSVLVWYTDANGQLKSEVSRYAGAVKDVEARYAAIGYRLKRIIEVDFEGNTTVHNVIN